MCVNSTIGLDDSRLEIDIVFRCFLIQCNVSISGIRKKCTGIDGRTTAVIHNHSIFAVGIVIVSAEETLKTFSAGYSGNGTTFTLQSFIKDSGKNVIHRTTALNVKVSLSIEVHISEDAGLIRVSGFKFYSVNLCSNIL